MLDPAPAYPMLRRRRRRRWRVSARALRLGAAALLLLAITGAGAWWLTRPAPVDARASLVAALTALDTGDYSRARDEAARAAAAAPRSAVSHAVLARALLELGQGVAAEGALTRAVAAGMPPARIHQLVAHARLLQGDPAGALTEAAQAAPAYADYADRVAARALAASDRIVEARARLAALTDRAPQDGPAWTDLAQLQLASGDLGGAARAAAAALRLRPGDPSTLTLAAQLVRARYGLAASLPWFEAALKRDGRYYPALIEYAATLGEAGRNADMLAALRRAAAARPGSPQPLYLQAVLAARAGRLDLAASLLDRAGGGTGAGLLRAVLAQGAGRWEQASAQWRDLLDAQPMNLSFRRLAGAALLRGGDPDAALQALRPLVLRGDADTYALTLAARALEASGDRAGAALYLDRAAAGATGASTAFATDAAPATLLAAAADAPGDPTYVVGAIRGLIGAGNAAAAVDRARALVRAGPGAPDAWIALGDAQALGGRDPTAAYARAADLRFDEPSMLRLVDAQARAGRRQDAAATLALYLSQAPQSLAARRLLGRLQLDAGQFASAIETLEGVRARVGNADAQLLAQLAAAYAGDDEGEVALRYAHAAYALQPMNAFVCDAYGLALVAANRPADARQLLDKAVALAPGDAGIRAHRRQLG